MGVSVFVHAVLFTFNFLASIIQGLTGFGDAVLLHVLWYTACVASPDDFLTTPLGPNPVSAVTLLMYVRIIFSTPLVAYLSFKDGIFSWSMTIAMAVPSTVCAIAGVWVFRDLQHGDTLKLILGISSLIFAILYVVILAAKYAMKQRKIRVLLEKFGMARKKQQTSTAVGEAAGAGEAAAEEQDDGTFPTFGTAAATDIAILPPGDGAENRKDCSRDDVVSRQQQQTREGKDSNVTVVSETELVKRELAATRNNSFANAPSSLVAEMPACTAVSNVNANDRHSSRCSSRMHVKDNDGSLSSSNYGGDRGVSAPKQKTKTETLVANGSVSADIGERNSESDNESNNKHIKRRGLNLDSGHDEDDSHEVFFSLETGSPFHRREARPITVAEDGPAPPPLTPSMVSPNCTVTYTRVRINRNLDANGKIKLSTKIGAAISAVFTGLMGSLTGVGAPPQIIFILLMDVPQYVIRVNFAMQSIPSALCRFIMAFPLNLFHKNMIPIFVNAVIAGYAGVFVGIKLGKMLGPKSYSVFVLAILLLASLIMVTTSVGLLVGSTVGSTAITVAVAYWEKRNEKTAKIAAQRAMEAELATAEGRPTQRRQRQQGRGNADDDDESGGRSGGLTSPPPADNSKAAEPVFASAAPATLRSKRPPAIVIVPHTARIGDPRRDYLLNTGGVANSGGSNTSNNSSGQHYLHKNSFAADTRSISSESNRNTPLSHSGSSFGRIRKADLNRPPSLFSTPTLPPTAVKALPSATLAATASSSNSSGAATEQRAVKSSAVALSGDGKEGAPETQSPAPMAACESMKTEETAGQRQQKDAAMAEDEELPM